MEPAFVSIKPAAAITSLSDKSIRLMIQHGDLDAVRHGRRILIPSESLQQWIDGKTVEARQDRCAKLAQQALRGRYPVSAEPESLAVQRLRASGHKAVTAGRTHPTLT